MVYPFLTAMRLEVEDPTLIPAGKVLSDIKNPDGATNGFGGWGWITPASGTVDRYTGGGGGLVYDTAASGAAYFHSEPAVVTAGNAYSAGWTSFTTLSTFWYRATVQWLNATGGIVSSSATGILAAAAGAASLPNLTVPASTVEARLRFDIYGTSAGANPTSVLRALFRDIRMGPVSDPANVILERLYTNILPATSSITVEREPLNANTLTATIPDVAYDPAGSSSLLRSGRRVRLTVPAAGWVPLFYGDIDDVSTSYDPTRAGPKRATVTFTALDDNTRLANAARPDGYAGIDGLRAVMEGAGVPWRINSSEGQIPTPATIVRNDSASALDQIVIARDSARGYAWIGRTGQFNARTQANMNGLALILGHTDYDAELQPSFDLEGVINTVKIVHQRRNAATGETVEVPYGPFEDKASRAKWGPREATFTVAGLTDTAAAMQAFADDVFARSATPQKRVKTVSYRISSTAELTGARALIDLYDLVQVTNPNGLNQTARVTKITHRITPGRGPLDGRWRVDLEFGTDGGVATPRETPPVQNAVDLVPLFVPSTITGTSTASIPNNTITTVTAGWSWETNSGLLNVVSGGVYSFIRPGSYLVVATLNYSAASIMGRRMTLIYRNGVEAARAESGPGSSATQVVHLMTALTGDTLDFRAFQTSGGALSLVTGHRIQVIRLAPGA